MSKEFVTGCGLLLRYEQKIMSLTCFLNIET